MDKLKKWVLPTFDDEMDGSPAKKTKMCGNLQDIEHNEYEQVEKSLNKSSTILKAASNTEDWMRHFDPKKVEDLAVHNKKIQEVDAWLCNAVKRKGEMLLLTGPVGCGKTATVQMLAEKHNLRVREWITPLDTEILSSDGKYEFKEKQGNIFKKFLVDAGCYTSLLQSSNSSTLLLVEDFPTTCLRNPSEFTDALQHYRERRASSPVVFICSECRSDNRETSLNLFSNAVKENFNIHHITFNNISPTGLKMALRRVSQIIRDKLGGVYNPPSLELQECVANSSAGDVRSAVLNLHFASLRGIKVKPSEKKLVSTHSKGKKSTKKPGSRFQAIGKDESVTLLHAVGRVLNPKQMEVDGRRQFTNAPSDITDEFASQPASFVNFLHENYLPHFSRVEHAARAAALLGDADLLLSEWREKFCLQYGLHVAVAGLMIANKAPVSAWNPVRGPKTARINYPTAREIPLLDENQLYNGKVLVSDYKTYCNIINSRGS